MTGKLAIVGPGASGKDYLRKRFMDRNFRFGISCTTRFPRETEVEGEDYFFLSDEEFDDVFGDQDAVKEGTDYQLGTGFEADLEPTDVLEGEDYDSQYY